MVLAEAAQLGTEFLLELVGHGAGRRAHGDCGDFRDQNGAV